MTSEKVTCPVATAVELAAVALSVAMIVIGVPAVEVDEVVTVRSPPEVIDTHEGGVPPREKVGAPDPPVEENWVIVPELPPVTAETDPWVIPSAIVSG